MNPAASLIVEVESQGVKLEVTDGGKLRVTGPDVIATKLRPQLAAMKVEIISELRRRSEHPEEPDNPDDDGWEDLRHYADAVLGTDPDAWVESSVGVPPPTTSYLVNHREFVVAANPEPTELAVCLTCGASWELHGKPARNLWVLIKDIDSVQPAKANFISASPGWNATRRDSAIV